MKWKNNKSVVSIDSIKSLVKCFMVRLTFLNRASEMIVFVWTLFKRKICQETEKKYTYNGPILIILWGSEVPGKTRLYHHI